MLRDESLPSHPSLAVIARALFASLFLLSGVTHFTNIPYYVGLTPEIIPFPVFWTLLSGAIELAGAVMILLNWRPRLGAWLIIVFLVPVTAIVHGYGMIYAEEAAEQLNQQAHFLKGCALLGSALLITQLGVKKPT